MTNVKVTVTYLLDQILVGTVVDNSAKKVKIQSVKLIRRHYRLTPNYRLTC